MQLKRAPRPAIVVLNASATIVNVTPANANASQMADAATWNVAIAAQFVHVTTASAAMQVVFVPMVAIVLEPRAKSKTTLRNVVRPVATNRQVDDQ